MITTYTLTRDGERDLRFDGVRIGAADSKWSDGTEGTRWTELELYQTVPEPYYCYVLSVVGRTQWQGERNRYCAYVCNDEAAVIAALEDDNDGALGWLVKELLQAAGIEAVETI